MTEEIPKTGESNLSDGLEACPCGMPIDALIITDAGQGGKWAWVSGDCCGKWSIEFRTGYNNLESSECRELATKAWNSAPRAANALINAASTEPNCAALPNGSR